MEASDRQISEDPRGEADASLGGDASGASTSDDQTPGSHAIDSSVHGDESAPSTAAETTRPLLPRELSLWEFTPISDNSENRPSAKRATRRFRPNLTTMGIVAGLGCLVCMGAGVTYDRVQYSRLLAARAHDNQSLASAFKGLEGRLAAIEVARDKDEATDLRRVLTEIKTATAATRDFGTTLGLLSSRVDHIEKDQSARFDKLGDRLDHDTSLRLADIAMRLDKLEKKPPVVASVAPAAPAPPIPPKTAQPQAASNDVTGSIEKPKPRLRGFTVADVRDGYVVVDGRDGPQPVAAGDFIPGAGRVLRIERHGHEWTVVTTQGVITEDVAPY